MKKSLTILILALISIVSAQRKDLTLADIYKRSPFETASIGQWQWLPNTDAYSFSQLDTFLNTTSIYKYDLASSDTTLFVDGNRFVYDKKILHFDNYSVNLEGDKLVLETNQERIWRRSTSAIYYLYDMKTLKIKQLAKGNRLRNVKFSPNGKSIAYVKSDNNLYVYHFKKNDEKRLTKDGSFDIVNGHFGWVYEEEFGSYDAYRWSPDSKFIAFARDDESFVKQFPLIDEMTIYPEIRFHHYPKVGENNPIINIGVANVNTRKTKWLDLAADEEMYYPRFRWLESFQTESANQELIVKRINRRQNHMELVRFNVKNGKGEIFWSDDSEAWVECTDNLYFLNDGSFVTLSERSGFRHIYHFDKSGEVLGIVTTGNWEVSEITQLDKKNKIIYFIGKKNSILEANLYSVKLNGSDLKLLDKKLGWHEAHFSPSNKYYIDYYSTADRPLQITLHESGGEKVRNLSVINSSQFEDYDFSDIEFIQIPTTDDSTLLNAKITLPRDFNPAKKYPVIVYGYSGPGSQVVMNRENRYKRWHQYMNQEGYITFSIDPRGTGGRGTAFKYLTFKNLGKWMEHDLVEGAKYLSSLTYVDGDRIGIWGWSGGGYMTALCMTKGAPHFKVGVAVAPVTDFRLYDSIWTERYMGLPSENKSGYDDASIFTHADKLEGKLLLIHGTADDNVHLQNTLQLMEKFVRADKQADMLFYPNRNHGIFGDNATFHLWTKITNYFMENL